MKKVLSILLALTLVLGMSAAALADTYEIAMITDIGTIDDKSFNQGTWEGIVAFCDANSLTYNYYQPSAAGTEVYLDEIEKAVNDGAKVIVTPGFLFEEPIFIAQDMYPDVKFVLIDGNPHDADYTYRTNDNAVGIVFAEEQVGYLAGYAAVKDGYTKLGFMGGMAVPAVIRYGYGFVLGAEDAAAEMGIADITMNYHYTGGFAATPEAQALAAAWYNDGIEVIFACGGAVGNSAMAAAEAANGKVIGVDVDQSGESQTVITSAMKGLAASVEKVLAAYAAGEFPGGQSLTLGAADNGVSLPMENSKFATFTQADYDALYAKLAAGEVAIKTDADAEQADGLGTTIVKVAVVQ
ncbi:MAG: BMP family ABC transporter substrate-binding protein [Clostridiales bacterium]|nr:BMP family ABC transporter substrate-binding protein [Clostridiales bacterium]